MALRRWLRKSIDLSSRSSVRRAGIALADQLVASATNFFTGIIVGRACAQEDFGLYMLGFSIVQIAIRLQTSLVATPYMVFSPRLTGSERSHYGGSTLVHHFGISAAGFILLVASGLLLSCGFGPGGLAPVVWALSFTMVLILLREYARSVCFADLRFSTALILDSVAAVLQIGALLALASVGLLHAALVFWVMGIACGVAGLVWLVRSRLSIRPLKSHVISDLRRNWSFGKWIFASSILFDVGIYSYPWILTFFHGPASTGIWAACFGVVAITNPIIIGMVNQVGPEIVHSYADGGIGALKRVVHRTNRVFMLLLAPASVVLLLFGDQLVVLLYGAKYGGYGLVVSLLAVDIWLSPPRFTLARALFAIERADIEFVTNFAPLVVVVALGLWLVKLYGPFGVAGALLGGNSMAVATKFIAYRFLTRSCHGKALR
jgi:O-antigen/teichoic acid export membrane protein